MSFISITLGLVLGNFIFQFLQPAPDYLVAFERSYIQALAIFVVWSVQTISLMREINK